MSDNLLSTLYSINPAGLQYHEWTEVGMALKAEGYGVEVWDEWSKNDHRYKPRDCFSRWNGFGGEGVKGGTIIYLAQREGWQMPTKGRELDWNDTIERDGMDMHEDNWNPASDLKTYLELLFEPDEYVAFVTDVREIDGKFVPASAGFYGRTRRELVEELDRNNGDIGAVFGDPNETAGAWIRFNPVDGKGAKNENVTAYRYALVESDSLSIDDQYNTLHDMNLPIACMVHSGKKSIHAIVKIGAKDADEYRERVLFLYDKLKAKGFDVDIQNKNPSRLSRMPGVYRNGNRQYLFRNELNIGARDWEEWVEWIEGEDDGLPPLVTTSNYELKALNEPLIEGVLRVGHKMLLSGASKAGKSFLLIELGIAISEGVKWMHHFPCKQGKVLYLNFEIDENSFMHRVVKVADAMGVKQKHPDDLVIWNLRGKAIPLDKMVPKIVRKLKNKGFAAVIIDPIYKVITGDENNASEMAHFCNQFDRICAETGCAAIYCHHHSKGAQGNKKAMDRASGSGVFARDPDAIVDIVELYIPDSDKQRIADSMLDTAWQVEMTLREFPTPKPLKMWFKYPTHEVDDSGILDDYHPDGSAAANLSKSSKRTNEMKRLEELETAFEITKNEHGYTTISEMVSYGYTKQTLYSHLKEFSNVFKNENGVITRV